MVLCGVKAFRFAQRGATSDHSAQIPRELWGEKNIDCCSASLSYFPSSTPNFFFFFFLPHCKIIHFNHPTPVPLFLPLKLVIKPLTSFNTKRNVFVMQTPEPLSVCVLFYELLWQSSSNLLYQYEVNIKGWRRW